MFVTSGSTGYKAPAKPVDHVYSAGWYKEHNVEKACYWVDGIRKELEFPQNILWSHADAIAVENGRVYVAGHYWQNGLKLCYWNDQGKLVALNRPETFSHVDVWNGSIMKVSIAAFDGNVYIANELFPGMYWNTTGACVFLDVPADTIAVHVSAFAVENNSVFMGGRQYTRDYFVRQRACRWSDTGNCIALDNSNGYGYASRVDAVTVENGKVYAIGTLDFGDDQPCCWDNEGNSILLELPGDLERTSSDTFFGLNIAVTDGNINAAGIYNYYKKDWGTTLISCYWNEAGKLAYRPMELPRDYYVASKGNFFGATVLRGARVYSAGYYRNRNNEYQQLYWVDGILYDLGPVAGAAGIGSIVISLEEEQLYELF